MTLLLNQRRMSQPQYACGVDWANPITRGLAFLWSSNNARELITGIAPTTQTGTKRPTANGIGYTIGSQSDVVLFDAKSTPDLSGRDYTIMVWMDRRGNSTDAWRALISARDTVGAPGYWSVGGYGTDFELTLGGTAVKFGNPSTADAANCSYSVVGRPGYARGFVDGAQIGTEMVTQTLASGSNSVRLSQSRGDSPNELLLGDYRMAAIFKRALSAVEIASLHANPWQLFKPAVA